MTTHTFRFALRAIARSQVFAVAVILGMGIAVASAILVLDYTRFERSYDQFFMNKDRVYRVTHARFRNNEMLYHRALSLPEVGLAMKDYFPEIVATTRIFPISTNIEPVFTATRKSGEAVSFSEEHAYAADTSFYRVFDLKFVKGDPRTALFGIDKTVVSRTTALRYFNTTDVIGEVLKGKDGDLTITGVFEDLPENSHLKVDLLLSWFEMYGDGSRFTYDGFYNYVLLHSDRDLGAVRSRMTDFSQTYMGDYYRSRPDIRSEFGLQPLTSIHLDSHLDGEMRASGNLTVVNALSLVALFILVIALINHVNLNTSRSLQRFKEFAIRKTIGASKKELYMLFIVEASMMSMVSILIGVLLADLALPLFNTTFDTHIELTILTTQEFLLGVMVFFVIATLVSGLYPALVVSRLKPQEVLKGSFTARNPWFQKSLVTAQFGLSFILVVVTYTLYRQVDFMRAQDLGFDRDQKLVIKLLPSYGEESDSTFIRSVASLKHEIVRRSLGGPSTVTSSIPGRRNEWRGTAGLSGNAEAKVIRTNLTRVDEMFLKTYQLDVLAGRNFTNSENDSKYVIINEEAARQFGLNPSDAIGRKIDMMGNREIIGVLPAFHELGLQEVPTPSMFITGAGFTKFLTVSLDGVNISNSVQEIDHLWRSFFPNKPFEYFFLDQYFDRQYHSDILANKVIGVFAGVAVLVACLGLFALSIFIVHRKTKEIGIKKVLGASVIRVTRELCVAFLNPLILAALIGGPASFFLVKEWLSQYPYKVTTTLEFFALPFLLLLVTGLCTVLTQSVCAALRNPVETLKQQ